MAQRMTFRRWTADEIAYLQDNYDSMEAEELAEALGRTPDSVWERAHRLGLRKHARRNEREQQPDGPWYCPDCKTYKMPEEFNEGPKGLGSVYCKLCSSRKQKERRRNGV